MIYFKFYMKPIKGDGSLQKTKNGLLRRIIQKISNIFLANPDFDAKLQDVVQWYLEYDEKNNESLREIGIDSNNQIIVNYEEMYSCINFSLRMLFIHTRTTLL